MSSALLLIVTLLVAGYCVRRLGRFPENAAEVLNRFVIDICVPATILHLVPKLSLSAGLGVLAITPWLIAGVAYALALGAQRLLTLDRVHTTALFLATALGNTSFLGYPLCGALLGERAVSLAAVYDQLGSFLMLSTIAPIALGRVSAGLRPRPRDVVRRVLLFPPLLALIVALLPLPHPSVLEPLWSALAAPLVPLAMFAVGLQLRITPPKPASVLALGLGLKLALLPAVAWLIARGLGAPPLVIRVAVVETAMPTMITAGALMMAYGVATDLAAAFVSWGLLISLFTVPLWSLILR